MKIPRHTPPQHKQSKQAVEIGISTNDLEDLWKRHCPTVDAEQFAKSSYNAIKQYEHSVQDAPQGTKQSRDRVWSKLENSTKRLLENLDELDPEFFSKLEFSLLEEEFRRVAATKGIQSVPLRLEGEQAFEIFNCLSDLLRASRNQIEANKTNSPSAYTRDTDLNCLIRDIYELWSWQSDAIGVYSVNTPDGYAGPFYDLVFEIFNRNFDRSVYQSGPALGKRIQRVVYTMRGQDIG